MSFYIYIFTKCLGSCKAEASRLHIYMHAVLQVRIVHTKMPASCDVWWHSTSLGGLPPPRLPNRVFDQHRRKRAIENALYVKCVIHTQHLTHAARMYACMPHRSHIVCHCVTGHFKAYICGTHVYRFMNDMRRWVLGGWLRCLLRQARNVTQLCFAL